MKLELIGCAHRYAAEQMVFSLLPREVLERPDVMGTVTLSPDGRTARAQFSGLGPTQVGAVSAEEPLFALLEQAGYAGANLEQHMVKLAVYRALTPVVGRRPWGALSGVRPGKLCAKWLSRGLTPLQVTQVLTGLYGLERSKVTLSIRCAQESLELARRLAPNDISLYVGVPFCPTRCAYCSFISADVAGSAKLVEPYLAALCREIAWAGDLVRRRGLRVRSVYVGGGTPTTFSAAQLDRLLSALDGWLDREALVEFTVEAGRPDTITREKLEVLRSHGVGRVSVNPQTLEPHVLRAMGRAHSPEDFYRAYDLAAPMGFHINADLIAGLPQDSPEGFRRSLDGVLALSPGDVTVHTLALKNGAALLERPRDLPGEDAVGEMLSYSHRALPGKGYSPYYLYRQKYVSGALENVGWTRSGPSFYNLVMMDELHSVLALGAGGVTKVIDRSTGKVVRHNDPKYPREYLDRLEDTMREREEIPWPIN